MVQKHETFFLTPFAETDSLRSQGSVARDFWKSYLIRPRYSIFKTFPRMLSTRRNRFRAHPACNEISSAYAQSATKFVPRMPSTDCTVHVKTVHILPLAEHARKFVPRTPSTRWNWFSARSARDKIASAHAIIFYYDSKLPNFNASFAYKESKFWKTV